MRNGILWLTSALTALLIFGGPGVAQPPPERGGGGQFGRRGGGFGPGGFGGGGFGGGLERIVEDMNLSEGKKETTLTAMQTYQDNVRRFTAVANSALLLKMKDVLSSEQYGQLGAALDKVRASGNSRALTTDDVVARILSFDKNKDGKITKEELPERMQYLIEKGDANKDGALDTDEIKKLAADLPRDLFGGGAGRQGGFAGAARQSGPGDGLPPGAIERAVDGLKLADKTLETATTAVKAHHDDVRMMTDLARADLTLTLTDVLTVDELKKVEAAVERLPQGRPGFGRGGRNGRPNGRGQ